MTQIKTVYVVYCCHHPRTEQLAQPHFLCSLQVLRGDQGSVEIVLEVKVMLRDRILVSFLFFGSLSIS